MKLKDRISIVTGAGQGIGRATARRLAQEGSTVVVADINQSGLDETSQLITGSGGKALTIVADVSKRDGAQKIVDSALENFGRLDILINNAGITRDALTTRVKEGNVKMMSDEHWDSVLDVNLKGTWLMCQLAALPMIEQKHGRIVNTASIGGLITFPDNSDRYESLSGIFKCIQSQINLVEVLGIREPGKMLASVKI